MNKKNKLFFGIVLLLLITVVPIVHSFAVTGAMVIFGANAIGWSSLAVSTTSYLAEIFEVTSSHDEAAETMQDQIENIQDILDDHTYIAQWDPDRYKREGLHEVDLWLTEEVTLLQENLMRYTEGTALQLRDRTTNEIKSQIKGFIVGNAAGAFTSASVASQLGIELTEAGAEYVSALTSHTLAGTDLTTNTIDILISGDIELNDKDKELYESLKDGPPDRAIDVELAKTEQEQELKYEYKNSDNYDSHVEAWNENLKLIQSGELSKEEEEEILNEMVEIVYEVVEESTEDEELETSCLEDWECQSWDFPCNGEVSATEVWEDCMMSIGMKRTCIDFNDCGTGNSKPLTYAYCIVTSDNCEEDVEEDTEEEITDDETLVQEIEEEILSTEYSCSGDDYDLLVISKGDLPIHWEYYKEVKAQADEQYQLMQSLEAEDKTETLEYWTAESQYENFMESVEYRYSEYQRVLGLYQEAKSACYS